MNSFLYYFKLLKYYVFNYKIVDSFFHNAYKSAYLTCQKNNMWVSNLNREGMWCILHASVLFYSM